MVPPFFIDGAHCDRNGRLQAEPVLCSVGNTSLQWRKDPMAWFFLGLMPMKSLTPAERAAKKQGTGLRSSPQKLHHTCLAQIFEETKDIQSTEKDDGQGAMVDAAGVGELFLHFEVCFIIGDTFWHDSLCSHCQTCATKTPRPVCSCMVEWDQLDDW